MTLSIGNKIKTLRRQRGITQEQLAESIGISFQAVSKWENNIALPDITLAPALASYFGVTMDELFDYNLRETEEKIEAICDEAYTFRSDDPRRSREILEEGLKAYPDNDILLNNLLYVMDDKNDPDEVIRVAAKLIDLTAHGRRKARRAALYGGSVRKKRRLEQRGGGHRADPGDLFFQAVGGGVAAEGQQEI